MTHDSRLVARRRPVRLHPRAPTSTATSSPARPSPPAPPRCSSTTRSTCDVAQLVVDDTRRAIGPLAAALHDHPSRDLTVVGITGTNGKTTTTHLLASILRAAGRPTDVIGTLSGAHTTPEAPELQARLDGVPGRRRPGRRDGGLLARPRHAPRRRHPVRRRRVHQPRRRPPRPPRHARGVLPGQGQPVHARAGRRRRHQRRRRPRPAAARRGDDRDGAVLAAPTSTTSRSPPTTTRSRGGAGASWSGSAARSTSPTRSPRRRRPTVLGVELDAIVAGLAAADAGARPLRAHLPPGVGHDRRRRDRRLRPHARRAGAGHPRRPRRDRRPGHRRVRRRRRPRPRQAAADGRRRRRAGRPRRGDI